MSHSPTFIAESGILTLKADLDFPAEFRVSMIGWGNRAASRVNAFTERFAGEFGRD